MTQMYQNAFNLCRVAHLVFEFTTTTARNEVLCIFRLEVNKNTSDSINDFTNSISIGDIFFNHENDEKGNKLSMQQKNLMITLHKKITQNMC